MGTRLITGELSRPGQGQWAGMGSKGAGAAPLEERWLSRAAIKPGTIGAGSGQVGGDWIRGAM
jgi:hypothetical protein